MQTLVVMALKVESQGLFEAAGYTPFYCGVGSVKAAHNLTKWIYEIKPKHVINLGTAGSHRFNIGEVIECISFIQRQPHTSSKIPSQIIHSKSITDLPQAICGSGDYIETGVPATQCDIFDMEAYALAYVCQKMSVPFNSIKYITDSSNESILADWQKNLTIGADTLLTHLRNLKN